MSRVALALLFFCGTASASLYANEPAVIALTEANFQSKVISSDDVWIVEFYAPWCGHCKALVPEYIQAAKALKGIVKVGAVDMDEHKSVGGPYGVTGFPTIKIFGKNKNSPTDYQNQRDAKSISQAGLKALNDVVASRLGGGASFSGGGGGGDSKVVELTDSDFEEKVIKSEDSWMVAFVAPWCGHCKALIPAYDSASQELEGKPFHLGRVDATAETSLASKYKVEGFPTIKVFSKGGVESYNGGRSASDIIAFAENIIEASLPPPEVKQISDAKMFDEMCTSKPLCLVAFFPPIFDSSAEQRNQYIDVMQKTASLRQNMKRGFVWAERNQQEALEKAFNIGDYPALVALNSKKKRFSTLRGSFSESELKQFIGSLRHSQPIETLPAVVDAAAWDGKDAVIENQEEEMSLDDIMNEKLED